MLPTLSIYCVPCGAVLPRSEFTPGHARRATRCCRLHELERMQAYRRKKPWRRAARVIAARSVLPSGFTLEMVEGLVTRFGGKSAFSATQRGLKVAFTCPWDRADLTSAVLATPCEITEKGLSTGVR
jgi:hypothetical protein